MTPLPPCFLAGFMGCGKSTVGRRLAQLTRRPFVDLDDLLVREAGCSIPDLFAQEGEERFRSRERAALESLNLNPAPVVALGGGALSGVTLPLIKQRGVLVWLQVPFAVLEQRIGREDPGRPLWRDPGAARALLEARIPVYSQAHFAVDATGDPDAVAGAILARLAGESLC